MFCCGKTIQTPEYGAKKRLSLGQHFTAYRNVQTDKPVFVLIKSHVKYNIMKLHPPIWPK